MSLQDMGLEERMVADRRRLWDDFSRLLFWAALHAAVALIVVVMFAVEGPGFGTFLIGIILIGGNIAITAAYFMAKRE